MNKKNLILTLAITFLLLSCKTGANDSADDYEEYEDDNYLEEYIEGNKDKARAVKSQLEGIEDKRQEQMDNLFDD